MPPLARSLALAALVLSSAFAAEGPKDAPGSPPQTLEPMHAVEPHAAPAPPSPASGDVPHPQSAIRDPQSAVPASDLAPLPVREITVFKDGHAFVLCEGDLPINAQGEAVLDDLPRPVLGTFWPYAAGEGRLASVSSGLRKVRVERPALDLRDYLEANVGAEATVTEILPAGAPGAEPEVLRYSAVIVALPSRPLEERAGAAPPVPGGPTVEKGSVVVLKTPAGEKIVPIQRIADLTIRGAAKSAAADEEYRDVLTLRLDGGGKPFGKTARVGMAWLQKGLRWIPAYRVECDGKGRAKIRLEATLINELADLDGVDANLVVGVPTFAFKETVDPIALERAVQRLSPYFQENSQTAYAFSNAIMTQTARMGEHRAVRERPSEELGPEIASGKTEDLHIFPVKGIRLRKGERMVVPLAEYDLPYEDVYVLDLPFQPPDQVLRSFNNEQQTELARLLHQPKFAHKIRLTNGSKDPLTTAPALLFQGGRIVAQSMMTYTSPGARVDLDGTSAVDLQVQRKDDEKGRTPKAIQWGGDGYDRIDLEGTIRVSNHLGRPAVLEITRSVLGTAQTAEPDGETRKVSLLDERPDSSVYPHWWRWYGWPGWWNHLNGFSRISWKATLEAGKDAEFTYAWHYFWR